MRLTFIAATFLLVVQCGWVSAQEKFDLRLRWAKGDTHQMSVTLDQIIEQTLGPAHQATSQTMGVTYTFKVEDVDAQGNATISVHYDAVKFHAKTPSGVVDYDPTKPANGPLPVMVTALASLVGQSYAVIVNPHGTVTQVAGIQKMLENVLSHLTIAEGVLRFAVEKTIRQQLSEANLKQSLRDIFAPLPDHPVAIGESWTRRTPVTMGFPMNVETTYTLQGRDNGIATISVTGKVATAPNAMMDLGAVKMDYNLKGEQTGSLEIIESSGWTRASTLSQHLSGNATVRGPNVDPQTVPVVIQAEVRSEQK